MGISFYTFHTITYIVDAYRGVIRPTRNLFEFAAYVSLFSQLVAGPIVRFRQIEGDLENIESANRTRWLPQGVSIFVIGLVEGCCRRFAGQRRRPARVIRNCRLPARLAMLGYVSAVLDFCGYAAVGLDSCSACGSTNFDSPCGDRPIEFRRWHLIMLPAGLSAFRWRKSASVHECAGIDGDHITADSGTGELAFVIWAPITRAMLVATDVRAVGWMALVRRSVMAIRCDRWYFQAEQGGRDVAVC